MEGEICRRAVQNDHWRSPARFEGGVEWFDRADVVNGRNPAELPRRLVSPRLAPVVDRDLSHDPPPAIARVESVAVPAGTFARIHRHRLGRRSGRRSRDGRPTRLVAAVRGTARRFDEDAIRPPPTSGGNRAREEFSPRSPATSGSSGEPLSGTVVSFSRPSRTAFCRR